MKRIWLFFGIYLLLAETVFACSCANVGSACSVFSGTPVVFLGKVIRDTGGKIGNRFGRLQVEEVLRGLPEDLRKVEVDTMPRTSCYMALEQDEQYVIFGSRDPKNPELIHYHACSHSFRLKDQELLLDSLRVAKELGSPRLSGFVYQKEGRFSEKNTSPGLLVVAESEGERLETSTINGGQFEFRAIKPGSWTVKVGSPGWITETVSWIKSPVVVPPNGCESTSVYATTDGHIKGVVRNGEGVPVPDIVVEAFTTGFRGEMDSSPMETARTDPQGRYDIHGLPPGKYIVGINGKTYRDDKPYRATFYPNTHVRTEASLLTITGIQQLGGIDLVVPALRKPAELIVEITDELGNPIAGAHAKPVEMDGDIRRESDSDGIVRIPSWIGETYKIEAFKFDLSLNKLPDGSLRPSGKQWRGESGTFQLDASPMTIRVVLREVVRPVK